MLRGRERKDAIRTLFGWDSSWPDCSGLVQVFRRTSDLALTLGAQHGEGTGEHGKPAKGEIHVHFRSLGRMVR